MRISQVIIILFCFASLVISCKKIKAKKIAGEYGCKVDYSYWDISPVNIDSNWTENIVVENDKQSILIFDKSIRVDCLKVNGFYKVGDHNNYYMVKVIKDSLYYSSGGGGLGGCSSVSYRCVLSE